jgi:hypothetical protein
MLRRRLLDLGSKFGERSVKRFTADLARVGIGVYRPGGPRLVPL